MRFKNALKNSAYSFASYLFLFGLSLLNRKVFLYFLGLQYLGYEGLFTDIFSLLTIAELGLDSIIIYNLYQQVALSNNEQISILMIIYKKFYFAVGVFIFFAGLLLLNFIPAFVKSSPEDYSLVKIIFILNLFSILSKYFLAYKRTLFVAMQQEYKCVKVETIITFLSQILRFCSLIVFKNYIIYLLIGIFMGILTNVLISFLYNKEFSFIQKVKITKDDIRRYKLVGDIKNFSIHRLAYVVYRGTDNIVVTAIMGLNYVGLLGNYMLIKQQTRNVLGKVTMPLQASIGNYIYSAQSKEDIKSLIDMFSLLGFLISAFIASSFFSLFQPFIMIWLGKTYLLEITFVAALSINEYIAWNHEFLCYFRNSFGEYERDRIYMVLSAIANLVFSILFAYKFGLTGIMTGTVIGHLFIWYGRMKAIYGHYFDVGLSRYFSGQVLRALLALIEVTLTYQLCNLMPITILGFVGRSIICVVFPNLLNAVIFWRNKEFKKIRVYIFRIFSLIRVKEK